MGSEVAFLCEALVTELAGVRFLVCVSTQDVKLQCPFLIEGLRADMALERAVTCNVNTKLNKLCHAK
ncbi:hypothetical protein DPMN_175941 [Dreissena polymorpha]|uniref:Uncharacterized protein n=1 Tax=Dreissena polymorpha TaxID=45954 RepID=A0A9D4IIQ3_DREPO|nr:hypothetical protein DPMN_175941 [Dreissena polymorpha]